MTSAGRASGPVNPRHHPAKARSVIFLYMDGGPSQIDTFDPKPLLTRYDGRDPHEVFKVEPTQFNNVGKVMASPWKFERHGASGLWISSLFPHLAECADELAVIRSVVAKFPEHTSANYFLHTGSGIQGRPRAWGAWASYGLGSVNKDLPGFIVLNGGLIPPGGLDNFNSGFLPGGLPGVGVPGRQSPGRQHRPAGTNRPAAAGQARVDEPARRRFPRAPGAFRRHRLRHRQLRDGLPHADDGH